MPLSEAEKKQLEQLMAKDQEPEEPDFDVYLKDGKTGNEIRLPYKKAQRLLKKMGFDIDSMDEEDVEKLAKEAEKDGTGKPSKGSAGTEEELQEEEEDGADELDPEVEDVKKKLGTTKSYFRK